MPISKYLEPWNPSDFAYIEEQTILLRSTISYFVYLDMSTHSEQVKTVRFNSTIPSRFIGRTSLFVIRFCPMDLFLNFL